MLRIRVSPITEQDLQEGAKYYNRQQPGLGKRFEEAVKQTFDKILRIPQAASISTMTSDIK
ncbi:hypothetical protein F0919_17270 [Taibaiella lutea]|uniref:Type II toxin-antitoxin system RelE/ParE family toxin n=1 Tax=Taibaiella lutea TaxID=2608001 RepID=A0A5M6CBL2_9BACT|nr:hypothetical protein [Taibaiella lutea]KAA5532534.1 hypothetical protein F0919_17270 [Taibaiella lutea]